MRLKDKVAIITGGASGIGKAAADRFGQEGAILVIADMSPTNIDAALGDLTNKGFRAIGQVCDVSDQAQTQAMAADVVRQLGRIDILVNNAGISRYRPFATATGEDWDAVLNVDLKGVFFCAQSVAPQMRAQQYGRIVNISSALGTGAAPAWHCRITGRQFRLCRGQGRGRHADQDFGARIGAGRRDGELRRTRHFPDRDFILHPHP